MSHEIEDTVQIPHLLCMGIKFPTLWKTLIIKFPPPRDGKLKVSSARGMPGGGMLKLRIDRYITLGLCFKLTSFRHFPNARLLAILSKARKKFFASKSGQ